LVNQRNGQGIGATHPAAPAGKGRAKTRSASPLRPRWAFATAMKCSQCPALATAKMKKLPPAFSLAKPGGVGVMKLVIVELRAARAIQTVLSRARRSMVTFT
jgi:hypothetical protein